MKKFNDFQNSVNALSKEQMNSVKGGSTCQWLDKDGVAYSSSKEVALSALDAGHGVRWCCDSCADATWSNKAYL